MTYLVNDTCVQYSGHYFSTIMQKNICRRYILLSQTFLYVYFYSRGYFVVPDYIITHYT